MEYSKDIFNELNSISPLIAKMDKVNLFTVPDNYFDSISIQLSNRIKQQIDSVQKFTAPSVPPGYFDTLADSILTKIKKLALTDAQLELQSLSPLLQQLQPSQVFTVPPGYFDELSENITSQLQQKEAKITPFRKYSKLLKYAIAAMFTGMVALGIFKFTQPQKKNHTNAALPQYVIDGEKIQNVDAELADISEEEIIKYLQEIGTDVDMSLLTNSLNDKTLPSEEDYLYDEKALDNYLNNTSDFNN